MAGGRRHKHVDVVGHARYIAIRVAARHGQHRIYRTGPGGPRQRRRALRQVGVRKAGPEFRRGLAVRLQTGAAAAAAAGHTCAVPKAHFATLIEVAAETLVRAGEAVRLLLAQRIPPQQLRMRPVLGRRLEQRIQNRRSSGELLGWQRRLAQADRCGHGAAFTLRSEFQQSQFEKHWRMQTASSFGDEVAKYINFSARWVRYGKI